MLLKTGGCGPVGLILMIVGFCAVVGLLTTPFGTARPGYTNPAYAAPKGDCFVPPQGDPLWDAHYAENVNRYNCEAYQAQEQAQLPQTIGNTIKSTAITLAVVVVIFVVGFVVLAKR